MSSALLFQAQSLMIVALMVIGLYFKKHPLAHVKIMGSAITWDLLLIAQIELSRGAINKAAHAIENDPMLNIHVALALTTVLLYGAMVFTGRKILQGNRILRQKHKILGVTTFLLRIAVLITSFWAVK